MLQEHESSEVMLCKQLLYICTYIRVGICLYICMYVSKSIILGVGEFSKWDFFSDLQRVTVLSL